MTTNDIAWSEHAYYKKDPLPEIESGLLNSADIRRYVDKECLLEKDTFCSERMKPASYELRFLGDLYHWDEEDGRLQKRYSKIAEGDSVVLGKNSISYLWTEEKLRLPEYIAARFNLRIQDVHKGILLGTGPLIDPGFGGRLLIPLHNLTDNDYMFKGGEGIIWVEFTKVSKNDYWLQNGKKRERPANLVEFPSWKVIGDPHEYLDKAGVMNAGGVQSALKGALEGAKGAAKNAKVAAESARRRVTLLTGLGIIGIVGVIVGVVAVMLSAYQLSYPVRDEVYRHSDRIGELEETVRGILEAGSNGPTIGVDDPAIEAEEVASEASQPVAPAQ